MKTVALKHHASAQAKGLNRVAGPLYEPLQTYEIDDVVAYAGRTWRAVHPAARRNPPVGVGDGSQGDRDLLMALRSGFALTTSGGYLGATYVVTRTDDAGTNTNPTFGTLRYGLTRHDPLWIVFDPALGSDITITLSGSVGRMECYADKTIDGRGRNVTIQGDAQLSIGGWIASMDVGNDQVERANHIWAYVTRRVYPMNANHDKLDCFNICGAQTETGFDVYPASGLHTYDRVWLFHVTMQQTGDGHTDITRAGATGSRVTIDWCRFGPTPETDGWTWSNTHDTAVPPNVVAPPGALGQDNQADNSKSCLIGLDTDGGKVGDAKYPDSALITLSNNLYKGNTQRQPELFRGRCHYFNNLVSKWGLAPGIINLATDNDANHPGWGQTIVHTIIGSSAMQVTHDGELLAENSIFDPYTAGEDHLLQPLPGSTWKVAVPYTASIAFTPASAPHAYFKASGCLSLNGASDPAGSNLNAAHIFSRYSQASASPPYGSVAERSNALPPTFSDVPWVADWLGTPPYAYAMLLADLDLKADLESCAGNVQPWIPI